MQFCLFLFPILIAPHIRKSHLEEAKVIECLKSPAGVHQVKDDAEAPLEERLAARAGRVDVPNALLQEFVRFLIHGKFEQSVRSEQTEGEPCHQLGKALLAEFVGIAPETLPVPRP